METQAVRPAPTWSIVVAAKAPRALIKAFVAHHLELGVHELFVFFDDPDDAAFDDMDGLPRVIPFRCDDAYWARSPQGRPPDHRKRQEFNAAVAKAASAADWLAHIDTDEFLLAGTPVATMLASAPAHAEAVRVDPCESMFTSEPATFREGLTGLFRKRFGRDNDGQVATLLAFGELSPKLLSGLQGHSHGKVFLRTNSDCVLGIHEAKFKVRREPLAVTDGDPVAIQKASSRALPYQQDSVLLAHYFSLGYRDWCHKYLRRLEPERFRLTKQADVRARWLPFQRAALRSEAAVRELYRRLNLLASPSKEILELANVVVRADLELERKVADLFGPGDHGFSEPLPTMHYDELLAIVTAYSAAQRSHRSLNR